MYSQKLTYSLLCHITKIWN